jgi:2-haloacid dehalogenase
MSPLKHVVFDIVGTLVSFEAYFSRISQTIGPKLLSHTITARTFGYTWMTAAELEFTFLSVSSRHCQYTHVLSAVFYRTLFMLGVSSPRSNFTDAERDTCIAGYSMLELRPDAAECLARLRAGGFVVWALTTGDPTRVLGYFAKGGIEFPRENFITCDTSGVAKPVIASYKPALEMFADGDQKWFAAAHMWDVSAAVKAGFRGAYCTVYEQDACKSIFPEEMEVTADDLVTMAQGIVDVSNR